MDTIKDFHAVEWVRARRTEMYEENEKDSKAFDESVKKAPQKLKASVKVKKLKKAA